MDLKATMGAMTGNTSEDLKTLYNYVFQLTEEMRYLMSNLDVTNFNDLGLARYENGRLQVYSEIVEVRASKLESIVQGVEDEFGELKSSITQTAEQIELRVQGVETGFGEIGSTVTQTANSVSTIVSSIGSGGTVTAASIVAAINRSSSSVVIDADHVDISGFVTFSDLEREGQTTINGSNIKSGTIEGVTIKSTGRGFDDIEISEANIWVGSGQIFSDSGAMYMGDYGGLNLFSGGSIRLEVGTGGGYWEFSPNGIVWKNASGSTLSTVVMK